MRCARRWRPEPFHQGIEHSENGHHEEQARQRRSDAAPLAADPEDPSHALLHVPVNVRSVTLVVLTVLAVLAMLHWASAFFIPLMLGFMFSYALSPIVDALQRWRIPRAISAAVLILGILGGRRRLGLFVQRRCQPADRVAARRRPRSCATRYARAPATPRHALDTVQKAAAQLEQAAEEASPATPPARGVQRVVIEKPRFDIRDHLWSGTIGLASLIGQIMVVTFLTYFLLLSGDTFRRKLVKITGPTLVRTRRSRCRRWTRSPARSSATCWSSC